LISKYKSAKWVFWLILISALSVLFSLIRSFFSRSHVPRKNLPDVSERLKAKVEKVEEDALIARVRARVEAEKAEKRLEEIAKVDDGIERRKRLAEYLSSL